MWMFGVSAPASTPISRGSTARSVSTGCRYAAPRAWTNPVLGIDVRPRRAPRRPRGSSRPRRARARPGCGRSRSGRARRGSPACCSASKRWVSVALTRPSLTAAPARGRTARSARALRPAAARSRRAPHRRRRARGDRVAGVAGEREIDRAHARGRLRSGGLALVARLDLRGWRRALVCAGASSGGVGRAAVRRRAPRSSALDAGAHSSTPGRGPRASGVGPAPARLLRRRGRLAVRSVDHRARVALGRARMALTRAPTSSG